MRHSVRENLTPGAQAMTQIFRSYVRDDDLLPPDLPPSSFATALPKHLDRLAAAACEAITHS